MGLTHQLPIITFYIVSNEQNLALQRKHQMRLRDLSRTQPENSGRICSHIPIDNNLLLILPYLHRPVGIGKGVSFCVTTCRMQEEQ